MDSLRLPSHRYPEKGHKSGGEKLSLRPRRGIRPRKAVRRANLLQFAKMSEKGEDVGMQNVVMKKILIGIFSGTFMLAFAAAQQATTPVPASQPAASVSAQPRQSPQSGAASPQAGAVTRISPGSVIPVSLTKTIDAKKAKPGDEVIARVTQDVKSNHGEVIVAKDTRVMGRVTEAQARNKVQKESEVGIAFDRAVLKNGSQVAMPMSIQAIIGEENNQDAAASGNNSAAEPSGGSRAMAGPTPPPPPSATAGENMPLDAQNKTTRPPITSQTQGVIGISNLKLTTAASNSTQGSLVTSDKTNVKIESGTLMLLRVN